MPLTEKKFLENVAKYMANHKSRPFNKYSNYNLARIVEGLKGDRGKAFIINGKLLNTQRGAHIYQKGNLLGEFTNYVYSANGNKNAMRNAFGRKMTIFPTKANFIKMYGNTGYGNINFSGYNNYNKPSQLVFVTKARAAPKRKPAAKPKRKPAAKPKAGKKTLVKRTTKKFAAARYM